MNPVMVGMALAGAADHHNHNGLACEKDRRERRNGKRSTSPSDRAVPHGITPTNRQSGPILSQKLGRVDDHPFWHVLQTSTLFSCQFTGQTIPEVYRCIHLLRS